MEEWKIVIKKDGDVEITNCETAHTWYFDNNGLKAHDCAGLKELLRVI